jgi:hypothetical protein
MEAGHRSTGLARNLRVGLGPGLQEFVGMCARRKGQMDSAEYFSERESQHGALKREFEFRMGLNLERAIPSRDGRHLAIVGDTNTSNVWLLQNF